MKSICVSEKEIVRFPNAVLWMLNLMYKEIVPVVQNNFNVFFDSINGYRLGGVEEWNRDIVIGLRNRNVHIITPIEDKKEIEKDNINSLGIF